MATQPTTSTRSRARTARASTRARIVEAAAAELSVRPYADLSVDGVMARVGLTRTAFYRYFDDLPALMGAVMGDVTADLLTTAERLTAADPIDDETLREGLRHVAAVFFAHRDVVSGVAEAARVDPELQAAWSAMREQFVTLTAAAIASRRDDVPDPEGTARALTLMDEAFLLDALGRTPPLTADAALDAIWPIWRAIVAGRP